VMECRVWRRWLTIPKIQWKGRRRPRLVGSGRLASFSRSLAPGKSSRAISRPCE
jgi:hypothetical protein